MPSEHTPGRHTPGAVGFLTRVVRPIVGVLYRPSMSGWENLPVDEPYLLVSNHNAGMGMAELPSIAALWAEKFRGERSIAGFGHPIGFKVWPVTWIHRLIGSIPSTYEDAYDTLEQGVPILLFPGGDYECLRPVWQANQVDFGGRKGFLRIAREANVPIVPMGIRGSHYTAPILYRARWLAWALVAPRALGVKRWGISVLSIVGCILIAMLPISLVARVVLCWVWLFSPLIFLPFVPWTIDIRIGEPIQPEELFDERSEDELVDALVRVEHEIERLMNSDEVADERR